MAKIKLFLNEDFIKEYDLTGLHEFYLGRSPDCFIPLEADHGISRKHLKFSIENEKWVVECISKSQEFFEDNLRIAKTSLRENVKFSVPPYRFEFIDHQVVSEASFTSHQDLDISDRTMVVTTKGVPFLKVIDGDQHEYQVFQLEGHHWVIGRENTCSVYINYSQMSRRQFEIKLEEGSYFVTDCGSSNGTSLNGQPLEAKKSHILNSGDTIQVGDWQIYFELRDPYFEDQVKILAPALKKNFRNFEEAEDPQPVGFSDFDSAPKNQSLQRDDKKKKLIRGVLATFAVGILAIVVMDELEPKRAPAATETKKLNPFESLKPEQQLQVKESYRLAEQLYREGKWELSRQELLKIHALIPSYDKSEDLLKLVDQAYTMQQEMKMLEQQEKERQERDRIIGLQVAVCEKKLHLFERIEDLEACFAPIIDLDPENPRLVEMRLQVQEKITKAQIAREKRSQYQALVSRQEKLYQAALDQAERADRLTAIKILEKFASGTLPDPKNYRSATRAKIKSLRESIISDQKRFNDEGESALKSGDFKTAAAAFTKAVEINPEDEITKSRQAFAINELRKQMQSIFHEAILEESVGEVDAAKEKYKRIRSSSVPEEEYYKKSTIKLKRFGVL